MMDLSIIIVNWNTKDLLIQCIYSIYSNPPERSFEIIVVDNASHDKSQIAIRNHFPDIKLIENSQNKGFSYANNQGSHIAKGRLLLFLNSDTLISTNTLDEAIKFIDENPEIGCLGLKIVNPDGSFQASYAKFPTILSEVLLATGLARIITGKFAPSPKPIPGEKPKAVDWISGAFMLIRKQAFFEVSGFNTDYFLYSEEVDLCWRLKEKGWKVYYLPSAQVIHYGGASTIQDKKKNYINLYQSKIQFFQINLGAETATAYKQLLLIIFYLRKTLWFLLALLPIKQNFLFLNKYAIDNSLFHFLRNKS